MSDRPEHATCESVPRTIERVAMSCPSLFLRLRIFQIRALAALLTRLGGRASGRHIIARIRSNRAARTLLDAGLGFRRVFPSFVAAQACASKYIACGHEHPDESSFHLSIAGTVRESDYPVLFYLAPLVSQARSVFDLGGSIGNLFYSYQSRLNFQAELVWKVYDLPVNRPLAEKLASERVESRLHFANTLGEASGCDVFIASGSLHYFEEPLHEILRLLEELPKHVFANRMPCSSGPDLITVQDNRTYLVPCKLHSRTALIAGMQALGYELRSEWPVYERRLHVPTHPDLCGRTYFGFYFQRK